ncbi:MAG: aldo/keto reductase [Clostridiales bacterium]|nr:aldo/keto reductase [Clostridiales bacterium]
MQFVTLNDGNKMPIIGYGTYKITERNETRRCLADALEVGYRLIDTATFYHNEAEIGDAICCCGVARKELFVTTKLWTDIDTRDKTLKSVDDSLKKLKTDYLDLLLIHWPTPANVVVWQTMLELQRQGIVKSVGTSNFKEHHIDEIVQACGVTPAVNQVEFHPIFQQAELQRYCKANRIQLQAWSPLMRNKALTIDTLTQLADKYNVSVAQLILRWDIQQGITTIPKTTNKGRMAENIDIFRFEISKEDMQAIQLVDQNARQYRDPDNHGF